MALLLMGGGCDDEPRLLAISQAPALGEVACDLATDVRLAAGSVSCLADGDTRSTGESGTSFAFGDFDGDGLADAAVGMPGCAERNAAGPEFEQVGAVLVCWGRAPDPNTGLCSTSDWSCGTLRDPVRDSADNPVEYSRFGQSLAAWEVGEQLQPSVPNPPRHQLVVGAPGYLESALDVRLGAVRGFVLERGTNSLINAWWSVESRLPDIPTLPTVDKLDGARLGSALAVADLRTQDPTNTLHTAIAVGAPGYHHVDSAGVEHPELGAVEVFHSGLNTIFWNPSYPAFEPNSGSDYRVPHPFINAGSGVYLPSRVCGQPTADPDSVLADGSGDWCDGARYGSALAAGRILENRTVDEDQDGERDHVEDLVVGAPGSPGRAGVPGSGHVEVLNGVAIDGGVLVPIPTFGDPAAGDLYLDSEVAHGHPGQSAIQWEVHEFDLDPEGPGGPDEEGDGYGAALAVGDLVRTLFSDDSTVDHKHWRDELVIGVPGEDLLWQFQGGIGTTSQSWLGPVTDAGMFCIYQHGDEDLLPVGWTPGDDDDSAPPLPELVGKPEGSVPSERQQYCVGLESNPGVPEDPPFGEPDAFAYLGSSLVAGRLSTWDPDFQVAVGAPGPAYPMAPPPGGDDDDGVGGDDDDSAHDDDDSAGDDDDAALPVRPYPPAVDEGRVYVFHFSSIFDEGPVFSVDLNGGDFVASNSGPRVRMFEPDWSVQPVLANPAAPEPTAVPARFGAALGLHDIDCSGHPELFVGAPDTRWGTAVDDVVVGGWEATVRTGAPAPWFRVHEWAGTLGGQSESLKLVVVGTSPNAGYAYFWSGTNETWALDVIDGGGDDDDTGNDDDSATPDWDPCVALPVNLTSLPGPVDGVLYSNPGAAVPYLSPCAGTPAPEVEWSTPTGDRWAGFGPPRALPLRGFDFFADNPVSILSVDLQELGQETGLFEQAEAAAILNGVPVPIWPVTWLIDLEVQKVSATTGPIDLCPSLTQIGGDPLLVSHLNGELFPDCTSVVGSVYDVHRWWFVPAAEGLTCDEPWVP